MSTTNLSQRDSKLLSANARKKPLQLDVHTSIILLNKASVDSEKNTVNILFEIGFHYDVYEYLKVFDYFTSDEETREERLSKVTASSMEIPFDVINARGIEERAAKHYIREMDNEPVETIYMENFEDEEESAKSNDFLSDTKRMKNSINMTGDNLKRGKYRKFEIKNFTADVSFMQTERMAPFDDLHFFFAIMCESGYLGTCRIKFIYNKADSAYSGILTSIYGYLPIQPEPTITVTAPTYFKGMTDSAHIEWDRLYVSMAFTKNPTEEIMIYYGIPFLLYNYLVIHKFSSVEELLNVSATLVLANVALLLVAQNAVFALFEQAVLIQLLIIVVSTLFLASELDPSDDHRQGIQMGPIQQGCMLFNAVACIATITIHYFIARKENAKIHQQIEDGNFSALDTTV